MDETTMALLTGLLGTAIGAVLIGGALLAAFLVGKERGRRERVEHAEALDYAATTRLRYLEQSFDQLRLELETLRRVKSAPAEVAQRVAEGQAHRTPH